MCSKSVIFAVVLLASLVAGEARPDGSETLPLPGPGLSYGGIPYGSVSGDVRSFFKSAPSSGKRANLYPYSAGDSSDYAPIEQYLS